jgi:hypothetical protein
VWSQATYQGRIIDLSEVPATDRQTRGLVAMAYHRYSPDSPIENIETFQANWGLCPECQSLAFDPFLKTAQCKGTRECEADEVRVSLDKIGWFWWLCLPGCLPDGEPEGPFQTEQEALDDARG